MKWRPIVIGCLGSAALIAGLLALGTLRRQPVPVGIVDPAFEFYTKGHSNAYAGIDHWAHYGMRADRFVRVLQKAGYDCRLPAILKDDADLGATREMLCDKTEQWPISRALTIHAGIEHGVVDRLASAFAGSTLAQGDNPITKSMAKLLRKFNWMEPETLQVTGFRIDSIDTLSRMVADTLSLGGWGPPCTEEDAPPQCQATANDRMKSGFVAVPQGPFATGNALDMHRAMEAIRFTPAQKRGNDNRPEESLSVRVTDHRIWLDFVGKDLSAHNLTISIEIESKGGTPINLVTGFDAESKTIPLKGSLRRANDGSIVYLVPEAGTQDVRYSTWLNMPNKSYQGTFDQLAKTLPLADPAFIAPILKAIIGDVTTNTTPEESLGLYPVLRQIEQWADVIRALHPNRWLSPEQGNRVIAQAYPDDRAIRAAWAFALCESAGAATSFDANCVLRFVTADPDAAALVRNEIARLQLLYAELPDAHPLRMRAKRLNAAFSSEYQGKEYAIDR